MITLAWVRPFAPFLLSPIRKVSDVCGAVRRAKSSLTAASNGDSAAIPVSTEFEAEVADWEQKHGEVAYKKVSLHGRTAAATQALLATKQAIAEECIAHLDKQFDYDDNEMIKALCAFDHQDWFVFYLLTLVPQSRPKNTAVQTFAFHLTRDAGQKTLPALLFTATTKLRIFATSSSSFSVGQQRLRSSPNGSN